MHYDAMRDSHYGGGACIDIVIKKTFSATSKTNTANKGYPKKSILAFLKKRCMRPQRKTASLK